MDWRAIDPLTAEGLLNMARSAVRDTRSWVDRNAVLSHVGFRCNNRLEWEWLMDAMAGQGDVCMTYKPDGRKIPFIRLAVPLKIGGDTLSYIELPAPKDVAVDEPVVVVAYKIAGENRTPLIRNGFDVREQAMSAEDFIERDIGRSM
jgi:hypothetical protein